MSPQPDRSTIHQNGRAPPPPSDQGTPSLSTLTVTTVNVNGLRAATGKGFVEWLAATKADVVCLQEVRAEPEQLPTTSASRRAGTPLWAPAAAKGRAGVAVLSRVEPRTCASASARPSSTRPGRYAEIDLPGLTVASLYLPSGEVGTAAAGGEGALHGGVPGPPQGRCATAPPPTAARSWSAATGTSRTTRPTSRTGRPTRRTPASCPRSAPGSPASSTRPATSTSSAACTRTSDGPYSWWSYRGRAFDNDAGWRIDYQMATPGLADKATSAVVERAATHPERWSDHAPVTVTFDR